MQILRSLIELISVAIMILGAGVASSQNYPNHPIRIVTSPVGSTGNLTARLIAPGLSASLGQPVIVENRSGGIVPGEIVVRATPDGHTLLLNSGIVWILAFMQEVPFDLVRDFLPITLAVSSPNVLVVHPTVAANSVKELIALAKARPGELNYGSAARGSTSHIATELFKAMTGVNMVRIAYKGIGPAVIDLIGGQVQLMVANPGSVMSHVKSGRLRALAATSAQPSELLPGLPTVAASGVPGYEAISMWGLFAPAKTPEAIIKRLNQEIVKLLNAAEAKERLFSTGVEVVGSSPVEFAAMIKSDMARMGKVIKDAGIRAE